MLQKSEIRAVEARCRVVAVVDGACRKVVYTVALSCRLQLSDALNEGHRVIDVHHWSPNTS